MAKKAGLGSCHRLNWELSSLTGEDKQNFLLAFFSLGDVFDKRERQRMKAQLSLLA